MNYTPKEFTALEAKNYLLGKFKHYSELVSYSHEVTDNGVFCKKHLALMDEETLINVASDVHYESFCTIAHLLY
jgi:hypothetical protein